MHQKYQALYALTWHYILVKPSPRLLKYQALNPYGHAATVEDQLKPRVRSLILALGSGDGGAVLARSARCLSTSWRAPEHDVALAGIGAANDVPIARRLMVCRESEHRFE